MRSMASVPRLAWSTCICRDSRIRSTTFRTLKLSSTIKTLGMKPPRGHEPLDAVHHVGGVEPAAQDEVHPGPGRRTGRRARRSGQEQERQRLRAGIAADDAAQLVAVELRNVLPADDHI